MAGERDRVGDGVKQSKNWADLHPDILQKIMTKLHFSDQHYFAATCKNWNFPRSSAPPAFDKLPWLLICHDKKLHELAKESDTSCFKELTFKYILCDPHTVNIFQRETVAFKVQDSETRDLLLRSEVQIDASKQDWVLMHVAPKNVEFSFVFLNPFTDKVIAIPKLSLQGNEQESEGYELRAVNFSGPPPTPNNPAAAAAAAAAANCTVCAIYGGYGRIFLARHQWGNEGWIVTPLQLNGGMISNNNVIYNRRTLYLVTRDRNGMITLDCFDADNPSLDSGINNVEIVVNVDSDLEHFLVESGGQIMLANEHKPSEWEAFRFDFAETKWVAQESLGGQAMFIGSPGSTVVIPARGDAIGLADKIIDRRIDECVFDRFLIEAKCRFDVKEYGWIPKNTIGMNSIYWVQPR